MYMDASYSQSIKYTQSLDDVALLEISPAIKKLVALMRETFGGTYVEIVGDMRRLVPTEWAPAGTLGVDIILRIGKNEPENPTNPVKYFLRNEEAVDIIWFDKEYAMLMTNQLVYNLLKDEFDKLKNLIANQKPQN